MLSFGESIDRIDRRLDTIESRLIAMQSSMDAKFTAMQTLLDTKFTAIQSDQRSDFRWLLGTGLAGFGAVLGLIAHTQHWL